MAARTRGLVYMMCFCKGAHAREGPNGQKKEDDGRNQTCKLGVMKQWYS